MSTQFNSPPIRRISAKEIMDVKVAQARIMIAVLRVGYGS